MTADFSGYATRNNLRCSDGRTILADAFKENDGQIVPLVWQHGHDDPSNVLGHVKLENVADGVRAHAFFNSTAQGVTAKELVRHGDIKWLSIFANQLVERANQVLKGNIREVSLAIGGANPGAFIDNKTVAHSDGNIEIYDDQATIGTGFEIELIAHDADSVELELAHVDTSTDARTLQDVLDSFDEEQVTAVNFLLNQANISPVALAHADTPTAEKSNDTRTLQDVLDTLNEEQSTAVNFLLSQALTVESEVQHSDVDNDADAEADSDADVEADVEADAADAAEVDVEADAVDANADANADATDANADSSNTEAGDDAVQHANTNQEDNSMTHNVFDQANKDQNVGNDNQVTLSHDDVKNIIGATIKGGSLKDAVEDYALEHGITNIDYLFPNAHLLDTSPAFISRRMEWVTDVLGGVRKSPFSRIKTVTADITPDEARARGYIKGNMKNEEFFALSKRETTPQTIYKKQKLDRDDVIDIVDLDVVSWMKAEMKVMLDEELASAILIGDGRSLGDDDKIKEDNIRPVASDAELYVTTVNLNLDDASSSVEEFVDAAIANRRFYKGTGAPTFYTTEGYLSKFLTVKDGFGRRIYTTVDDVATVLRVKKIVTVETMERIPDLIGIMVNLTDYTLGADRGGQATMFDDFDINYNKLLYLLETRCSGALTVAKSAVVFRKVASGDVLATPTEPARVGNVVTVPTTAGVVYKNGAGTTLTTGAPVTLTEGQTLQVNATPTAGRYFATNAEDQWTYEYDATP